MIQDLLWSLKQWVTSLLWTSGTTSTVELGKSTGMKSKRVKKVPAVLYIDHDYWDAEMKDVIS